MADEPLINPDDIKSVLATEGPSDGAVTGLWTGETSPYSLSATSVAKDDVFQRVMTLHAGVALQIEKLVTRNTGEAFRCECIKNEMVSGKDFLGAVSTDNDLFLNWNTQLLGVEGGHLIPRTFFFNYFNSLFGGNRAFVKKGALTSLEETYLQRFLQPFFENLARGWADFGELNFSAKHILTDVEHVKRIRWNFDCIKSTFKIQWKDLEGEWIFIAPKDLLKSLATPESEAVQEDTSTDKLWSEAVWGAIHDTTVPVRAELGNITVPLQKVLDLQLGDTFTLNLSPEGHPVFVADQLTYQVSIGSLEGHRAIKINENLRGNAHG